MKNRCLFCYQDLKEGQKDFHPAYDMLSIKLVMPEDTEELALTLNAKKKKLKRSDFETAFVKSELDRKVGENIFFKFEKVVSLWVEFIDRSFIPEEKKARYKVVVGRAEKISGL